MNPKCRAGRTIKWIAFVLCIDWAMVAGTELARNSTPPHWSAATVKLPKNAIAAVSHLIRATTLPFCKANWQLISEQENSFVVTTCLRRLMAAAVPRLLRHDGSIEYGIEWSEPTRISGTKIVSTPVLYAEVNNVTVFGLASAFTPKQTKLRYSGVHRETVLSFRGSRPVEILADFIVALDANRILGKEMATNVTLQGQGAIRAENVKGTVKVEMKKPKFGALRVGLADMKMDASPVTFKFSGEGPTDRLADVLGALLSSEDMTNAIFSVLKEAVEQHFAKSFRLLFRHGFQALDSLP